MEIKVYTIRVSPPRWVRRLIVYVALPAGVLMGAAMTVRAGVGITMFVRNTPISSDEVNRNFAKLDDAVTALQGQIVPAGMIGMFAAACPSGWTPCDGSGTCPNLDGAYLKGGATFAGLTGSNTHTHAVSAFTTGSAGGHTPTATGAFTTSAIPDHMHYTEFDYTNSSQLLVHLTGGLPQWTSNHELSASFTASAVGTTSVYGLDSTMAGGHSHTVSVTMNPVADHSHAIPAFDVPPASHEPVHATLVVCMKN